ncbi:hypothetical protein UPYG_G00127400 [Umbra pygmaea]|uniref:Thioredoxin domain-containing protein n=1 Tax=Umbra pygmaea TaxID=75934 RepID=A0ABD0X9W3_UMBPY
MSRLSSRLVITCILWLTVHISVIANSSVAAEDNDELPEFKFSEDVGPEIEDIPTFVRLEDLESQSKRQYKTAEIADAVMGTEAPVNPAEENSNAKSSEDMESVTLEMVHVDSSTHEEHNSTETTKTYKVTCDKRNVTGMDNFTVQVLNASQDLMEFLNVNSTECSLVLFFTTWCQFSANLAPHFNALPRVFPAMHFLALDASQHSSLSTRFGTVAVPNILLFQGVKPMARFNQTDRTLETLTSFIANQTGFEVNPDQNVTEEDLSGPLPSIPVKSIDWLLVFSILFISGFTTYAILRTDSVRWLIPGQEHDHQD